MANELYHYGRLGMKWYQHIFTKNDFRKRRADDYKKYVTDAAAKEKQRQDAAKRLMEIDYKRKNAKNLTDQERLELERQYFDAQQEYRKYGGNSNNNNGGKDNNNNGGNGNSNGGDKNQDPMEKIRANDLKRKVDMMTTAKNTADSGNRLAKSVFDARKATKGTNVSSMTDDDLRQAINRMDLEKKYYDATKSSHSSAEAWVTGILSTCGDLLAVGVSAAQLYNEIDKVHNVKVNADGNFYVKK